MGSIMSSIKDRMDDYYFYCKELNIIPRDTFSPHGYWVESFYKKETTLTFEEYLKVNEKKELETELIHLGLKIKELQKKEAELIKKISEL